MQGEKSFMLLSLDDQLLSLNKQLLSLNKKKNIFLRSTKEALSSACASWLTCVHVALHAVKEKLVSADPSPSPPPSSDKS